MQGDCPTPGCTGIGHVKGAKFVGHHRYNITLQADISGVVNLSYMSDGPNAMTLVHCHLLSLYKCPKIIYNCFFLEPDCAVCMNCGTVFFRC